MSGITNAVFGQLRKKVEETSYHERITQKAVETLDKRADELETGVGELRMGVEELMRQALHVRDLLQRPFVGRLKWLLLGK